MRGVCAFERFVADGAALPADPDVDLVLITAPTTAHPALVRAVLAAGKPLLCEKPLAVNFELVRQLTREVLESGLVAQVGFHSRFHPLYNALAGIIERGDLGRPMGYTLATTSSGRPATWCRVTAPGGPTGRRPEAGRCSSTPSIAPTS